MVEGGVAEVALGELGFGELRLHEVGILQVAACEAGAFQLHFGEKGIGEEAVAELHGQAEAIAEGEVDTCHLAVGEEDVQPGGVAGFDQLEVAFFEGASLKDNSADALAGEVAFVEGTFVVVGFQFVDGEIGFFNDLVFHMVGLGDCLV